MNTCIISLKANGRLTQIPDSQKLFGALVYLFAEEYGEKVTTTFVQTVYSENRLSLSDVIPQGYLPTPHEYLMSRIENSEKYEKNERCMKQIYSALKK